ncbi:MAG: Ger(x)C family spore germination protein [Clostridia bacterium]|nr:Ger(x)C family spore germination protein [Clostridia bacterium]
MKILKYTSISFLLIILLIVLYVTGKYDFKEIEKASYILAIAIDKGEISDYKYTFYIGNYTKKSTENGESKSSLDSVLTTVEAQTVPEAINILNSTLNKASNTKQLKIILISKEVAQDNVYSPIKEIFTNSNFNCTAYLAITNSNAYNALKTPESSSDEQVQLFYDVIHNSYKNSGYTCDTRLEDYYVKSEEKLTLPTIAYLGYTTETTKELEKKDLNSSDNSKTEDKKKENEAGKDESKDKNKKETETNPSYTPDNAPIKYQTHTSVIGLAVFNDSKMIGLLDSKSTPYYLMLSNRLVNTTITLPSKTDNNRKISFTLYPIKNTKIKVNTNSETPHIDIKLNLTANVSYDLGDAFPKDEKQWKELSDYMSRYIAHETYKFLKETKTTLKGDIVGFSEYAQINFLTVKDFEKYNWSEKYKNSNFKVTVNISFRRIVP